MHLLKFDVIGLGIFLWVYLTYPNPNKILSNVLLGVVIIFGMSLIIDMIEYLKK